MQRTLLSIQYLRALAALAVVVYHAQWTRSDLGAAGVDVFFVISGFIMVHVSQRETTPGAFLRARIIRVVPMYWLVTLATAVLLSPPPLEHLALSLMLWPHPGPEGHGWPVVMQGWTLCNEMWFYALFAAALLLPPLQRVPALSAAILALVATGAFVNLSEGSAPATFLGPLMLEFLAGAFLCLAWRAGWLRRAAPALVVGLVAFVAQVAFPTPPPAWRWLAWGLPAALVVAGMVGLEEKGRLPRVPGLHALGNASYSIYLVHLLVLLAAMPTLRPLPAVLAVPLLVLACAAVGMVVHLWVERPLTRWLNDWRGASSSERSLSGSSRVP